LGKRARREAGLEPGISLQKYYANTRELRLFGSLALSTRALLRIFHRDEPDSSHCSLLGFSSPRAGDGVVAVRFLNSPRAGEMQLGSEQNFV
jgi:hypothetical protein